MKACAGGLLNFDDNLFKEEKEDITADSQNGLITQVLLILPLSEEGQLTKA